MNKREKKDIYAFPAVFEIDHDDGDVINVEFPDLPNCFTNAPTQAEALSQAQDALESVLYWMEHDGQPIPKPTDIGAVKTKTGQFKSLVLADMTAARRAWRNTSVSRTLTLPAWLDELARKSNVNVSQLLQQALRRELNVTDNPRYA